MPIRRILGAVLAVAAAWVLNGRYQAMALEVKHGNSWANVLSDVTYLIPGIGAAVAILGGVLALTGKGGWVVAAIGTALVLLFMGLVGGMSGNMSMIQPFLYPAIVMLAATIGLVIVKAE